MTVIAWDGITLAADKRSLSGGQICTVTKIRKINELLVGATGALSECTDMLAWVELGRKVESFPEGQKDKEDCAALIVIEGDRILRYDRSPYPYIVEEKKWAIGGGRDYALAAMHCGKTAKEAVEIACLFDAGCGNGVDVIHHG